MQRQLCLALILNWVENLRRSVKRGCMCSMTVPSNQSGVGCSRSTANLPTIPLFALHAQVDLSIINGEAVIRDGKLLTADLAAIVAEHNRRSEAICAHFTETAIGA